MSDEDEDILSDDAFDSDDEKLYGEHFSNRQSGTEAYSEDSDEEDGDYVTLDDMLDESEAREKKEKARKKRRRAANQAEIRDEEDEDEDSEGDDIEEDSEHDSHDSDADEPDADMDTSFFDVRALQKIFHVRGGRCGGDV